MDNEDKVTREVETTTETSDNGAGVQRQTVSQTHGVSGRRLAIQIIWYIVGLINVFLGLRVVLQLLGANQDNGFVSFVYDVSGFFAAPFFGMFSYTPSYGASYFEVSTVVAMLIYLLFGWLLVKLLSLGRAH